MSRGGQAGLPSTGGICTLFLVLALGHGFPLTTPTARSDLNNLKGCGEERKGTGQGTTNQVWTWPEMDDGLQNWGCLAKTSEVICVHCVVLLSFLKVSVGGTSVDKAKPTWPDSVCWRIQEPTLYPQYQQQYLHPGGRSVISQRLVHCATLTTTFMTYCFFLFNRPLHTKSPLKV